MIREALARAAQGGDTLSRAWAHIALGDAHLQFGEVDEAIDELERGLAIRDQSRFDMNAALTPPTVESTSSAISSSE